MRNIICFIALSLACEMARGQQLYHEKWRPQFHFSPKAHWMNDPNGMVYYKGVYHLFFQYYPDSSVWGPMHWGHAESRDLVHWQEDPIALFPDKLGYIFSGSAVVDKNNTSRFGQPDDVPLVAIFTQHDPVGAGQNRNDFQNQSIAYSLDNGQDWLKYDHNPVLKNPGNPDFRDPKVFWYPESHQWIMVLAVKDHVAFFSSPNLKDWYEAGTFGKTAGAHGGVWECPDLFPLNDGRNQVWVLIVNINPGGPNSGSATQYFLGQFDGKNFTPSTAGTRWLDYGPDEYAGVTWSNTGNRRIFLGWMSNWLYGQRVPTSPWRSANTLPRELELGKVGDSLYVKSTPVREVDALAGHTDRPKHLPAALPVLAKLQLKMRNTASFDLVLSNPAGDSVVIGYDSAARQYHLDRRHSGVAMGQDFDRIYTAPRISRAPGIDLTIFVDQSSLEVFADGGLTVMTALDFPSQAYNQVAVRRKAPESISVSELKSIHN